MLHITKPYISARIKRFHNPFDSKPMFQVRIEVFQENKMIEVWEKNYRTIKGARGFLEKKHQELVRRYNA